MSTEYLTSLLPSWTSQSTTESHHHEPSLPVLMFCVMLVSWAGLFVWNAGAIKLSYLKGPRQLPWFGNMFEVLYNEPRLNAYLQELTEKYGWTWHIAIPMSPPFIMTAEPANIKHILADRFENYPKGKPFHKRFVDLLGNGIFASDGNTWKTQRKTASHIFTARALKEDMTGVFIKHGHRLLDKLEKAADSGDEVDIFDEMSRLTLDSISVIAFGVDLQSQLKESVPFAKAFDKAQHVIDKRFLAPYWQVNKWLGIGDEAAMKKALVLIEDFAQHVVEERKKLSQKDLEKRTDLLSKFVARGQDDDGNKYTDEDYRDVILNFIIAGRDTTAQNLSWTMYELGLHKDADQKAHEEVVKVLGKEKDPDFDTCADKLPYITAVTAEALRLHPSVPKELKHAVENDRLPDGTIVPAGAAVFPLIQVVLRRKDVWGEDATEYRPERWLEMDKEPDSFTYPAFQAGPRTCLGKHMAQLEAKIVTSMVLRKFRLELVPERGDYKVVEATALTLPARHGIRVTVHRRE